MKIQLLFLGLFALNMLVCWLITVVAKKFEWYRLPAALIFFAIPLLTVFSNQPRFNLDYYWWKIVGIAAIILGLAILGWVRFEFYKAGMWAKVIQEKLITTGPFKLIRHPQLLALVFIFVGWWWVWSAIYSFYFGMIILALVWIEAFLQEKFILEKSFGDQYKEYRQQTGMFWIK